MRINEVYDMIIKKKTHVIISNYDNIYNIFNEDKSYHIAKKTYFLRPNGHIHSKNLDQNLIKHFVDM